MKARIIALLTDFGSGNDYVGNMKGVILSINSNVHLVDLCHAVSPHNIRQGAITLGAAYRYFPRQTIFVCVVDPGVGSKRKPIILKTKDYLFVAPDNGLLTAIYNEEKQKTIYTITDDRYFLKPVSPTFHGRDIFSPVAAYLSKGVFPSQFGLEQKAVVLLTFPPVRIDYKKKRIIGEVTEVDHFGNLITNIEQKHLRKFNSVQVKNQKINRLSQSYASARPGELVAVIGSRGCLELAVNQRSAAKILKVLPGEKVVVTKSL